MSAPSALSITDSECILHKFQQVIAVGKPNRTPQRVATLEANICPMKAKVGIVFRKFRALPDSVQQDLRQRFRADIDGISSDKTVFHLIPLPLQTQAGLSQEDLALSLSRISGEPDQFPLVTKLEWAIQNLDSKEGLSQEEQDLVDMIQAEVKKSFPNASESKESIAFIGEVDGAGAARATRPRRRRAAKEDEGVCSAKLLLCVALLGLIASNAFLQLNQ